MNSVLAEFDGAGRRVKRFLRLAVLVLLPWIHIIDGTHLVLCDLARSFRLAISMSCEEALLLVEDF